MLDNNTYNLMAQMVEEHKSLWRIKNAYKQDAQACGECEEFWDRLYARKEEQVRELEHLVRQHLSPVASRA